MWRKFADIFFWLGVSLYFGGLITVGAIVAPAVFDTTRDRAITMPGIISPPLQMDTQVGGEIFGEIINRFGYLEALALALMLAGLTGSLLLQRAVRRITLLILVLWIFVAALAIVDAAWLRPKVWSQRTIVRDEAAQHLSDTPAAPWPAREQFDSLHRASENLGHIKAYLLLAIICAAAWRARRSPHRTRRRRRLPPPHHGRHPPPPHTKSPANLTGEPCPENPSQPAKPAPQESSPNCNNSTLMPTARLNHRNAYELLVATILSAQCTDVRVNLVTPALFAKFPDAAALAAADPATLEKMIQSTGFFRSKAKSLRESAADIVAKHAGQVPATMEQLTALRGVGRKTANVVLGNAFGQNVGIVGRHPRHPPQPTPRPDRSHRPRQNRTRPHETRPTRSMDSLFPLADLSRPPDLPRPQAPMHRLQTSPLVPHRSSTHRRQVTRVSCPHPDGAAGECSGNLPLRG